MGDLQDFVVSPSTLGHWPVPNWVIELFGTLVGVQRKHFEYDFVFGKTKTNLRLYSFHCLVLKCTIT